MDHDKGSSAVHRRSHAAQSNEASAQLLLPIFTHLHFSYACTQGVPSVNSSFMHDQ